MELMKTGSRLSVQPVEAEAYAAIVRLADQLDADKAAGARGEGMSELLHSPDAELAALKARVARLERLEEQVYFQERTLSALNEAITLQQRQLDDLQGRMEAVEEKFRELWELVGNEGGEATVPPHYMKLA